MLTPASRYLLCLGRQVLKSDVEAALKVLNFAIYHQELNEMDEREEGRERELERRRKADHDGGDDGRADRNGANGGRADHDGTSVGGG